MNEKELKKLSRTELLEMLLDLARENERLRSELDEANRIIEDRRIKIEKVGAIYWSLVTAVYLAWSFITNNWSSTWIIWPVAGVLFAPFSLIMKNLCKSENE